MAIIAGGEKEKNGLQYNFFVIIKTHIFNTLLEKGGSRKHMRKFQLSIGNGINVEKLSSRNSFLYVIYTLQCDFGEFSSGISFGVQMKSCIENSHFSKSFLKPFRFNKS